MTSVTYRITLADNTIGAEEIAAVTDVLTSRWLTAGAVTKDFEERFADALDVPDAVAVSSGTAALHLAVLALGVGPGDEVIMPSLTFVAGAAVVALHGGTPVFADVLAAAEPTIAPEEVGRLITERTKAIVVMHYGGYPARTAQIVALARERGIAVIEDTAHAPVVSSGDGMLGTLGDVGCFSFFSSKNMTTGEGGMVVGRPDLLEVIRAARAHCLTRSSYERMRQGAAGYDVPAIGLNYRPTEISSALGRVQLGKLSDDRTRRLALVGRYHELLGQLPEITVPFVGHRGDSAHHLMAVVLPRDTSRQAVQAKLDEAGVQTSVHYPPTHLLSRYRHLARPLAVTDDLAGRLLSLPLHARMSADDVGQVVDRLARVVRGREGADR